MIITKYFCLKCRITPKKYTIHLVPTLWALRLLSLLQVPLQLADESDDERVNVLFRSGKWKDHKDGYRVTILCNVSTGRGLQLIAMAMGCAGRTKAQSKMWEFELLMRDSAGCAGRTRAQPKMWEFELLMRDSGMSCVFARYSSKNRDSW